MPYIFFYFLCIFARCVDVVPSAPDVYKRQDHKRAQDGDRGLNTGGMGVIAPNPYYTPEVAARCMEEIFLPTLTAMREEGCPFRG